MIIDIRATAARAAVAVLVTAFSTTAVAQPADPLAPLDGPAVVHASASVPDPLAPLDEMAAEASQAPSPDVTRITNWVISTRDNGELPFMVIDKVGAEVFL